MAKYVLTNKAVADLTEIWNYTLDHWSERQADIYYSMLIESCEQIAERPDIGKNYERIVKRLLGLRAGSHVIFYRKVNANKVEITRILHEQMDLKNRVLE
jgi:toxin ParE1/3/4